MNVPAHLSFGIFSGFLVYYLTQDWVAAFLMFMIQIGLVLDYLFKKTIHFEPLHTVLALLIISLVSFVLFPAYSLFIFSAYSLHLFFDIFVEEKIPLLYPLKTKLMFPLKYSEKFVITLSLLGSLTLLFLILF